MRQDVRLEHDSLGEREIPASAYWGVQTLRAIENFPISGIKLLHFPAFITALALVKKAAAQTNAELGVVTEAQGGAIVAACDEIAAGALREEFVVDMFQGGAGTSTNMNANEVITNRALELMGHAKGEYAALHPNDHVNASQSTNDAYPTAVKLAVLISLDGALAALDDLAGALAAKAAEFADVIKMGRTQLQDAVPMTLGMEFNAYATMVRHGVEDLRLAAAELHAVSMGATAIGTGINAPVGFGALCTQRLAEATGRPLRLARDLVEATQDSGAFVAMSAGMKRVAVQLSKICNDLRLLSSGPRAGLREIHLPDMQPGSSIMPGKVNPVIPEIVNQVCFQIIGYDMAITMAAEASQLELNMAEPIIAFNLLHGLHILTNATNTLTDRCVRGITADRDVTSRYVEQSIGLATALNPLIGYERAAQIAKEALRSGRTVREVALEHGWLTAEQLDELLRPELMLNPRQPRG